jgi:endogenous inhibitor of DNA gyrase (YacG/DUF329 family)
MTIQFQCASCGNPIEIDDEWGGKAVACPYCRKSVTAPMDSTFVPETAPSARAIGSSEASDRNTVALWAFWLSLASLVVMIGSNIIFLPKLIEIVGMDSTADQARERLNSFVQEHVDLKTVPGWLLAFMASFVFVVLFWLGGLICAVLGLRSPVRRGWVYAALGTLAFLPLSMLIF